VPILVSRRVACLFLPVDKIQIGSVRAVITAKPFIWNSIGCSFYLISSQVHSTLCHPPAPVFANAYV
jgi:hypothetical protein